MAKQPTANELTTRGADRLAREEAAKAMGLQIEWSNKDVERLRGQKGLQTEVRQNNLRSKAKLLRTRKVEQLPEEYRNARLLPSYSEYYEEMPDADGREQIRRRKTKAEAIGARFTLRYPGVTDKIPGEKFHFRMPLDGTAVTWEGPHIDAGFTSEDLILAIIADSNWCPRNGNSGYYLAFYSPDEVERLSEVRADEEYLLAQEEKRRRIEETRPEMAEKVEEARGAILV